MDDAVMYEKMRISLTCLEVMWRQKEAVETRSAIKKVDWNKEHHDDDDDDDMTNRAVVLGV